MAIALCPLELGLLRLKKKIITVSLPSADNFHGIFLATLPVSALPAYRKTALPQWRPLQAQFIELKKL